MQATSPSRNGISTCKKAQHEPIISYQTFERIQERLAQKARVANRKDLDEDFILRGFVTCGSCNKPMTSCWSRSSNQSKYAYYLCQQKGCEVKGKSVRREIIEEEFDALMRTTKPQHEVFEMASDMLRALWDERRENHKQNKKATKQEYAAIDNKIAKLVERIVNTESYSLISAYENSIRELEKSKVRLEEQSRKCSETLPEFDKTFRTAMEFLSNPYKTWVSGTTIERRAALRMVFTEELSYTLKQGFRTPSIAEPLRLCGTLATGNEKMVPTAGVELATY